MLQHHIYISIKKTFILMPGSVFTIQFLHDKVRLLNTVDLCQLPWANSLTRFLLKTIKIIPDFARILLNKRILISPSTFESFWPYLNN